MSISLKDATGASVSVPSPVGVGQAAMAGSIPVAIASDQSSIPVTAGAGSAIIGKVGLDQSTPGTTNGVVVNALPTTTVRVVVTPTVQAISYGANKVMGGILAFASLLPAASPYAALLESITLKFKGSVQTVGFYVSLFSASPSGTFTDNTTAAIGATDSALLLGVYHLTGPVSVLGTHTIFNLDGVAKAINGSSSALYAVVTPDAATGALGSASDMSLEIAVIGG